MSNGAERLRRELMIRVVRGFFSGTLSASIDRFPRTICPQFNEPFRCCVWHDREVLRNRLLTLLGFACDDGDDGSKPLHEYLAEAEAGLPRPETPLTVCSSGCAGCPEAKINVTSNCRGCFARPCVFNCPKGAITVSDRHAHVDDSKCIKCGKCLTVCPFNAIIRTRVPCEEACPVGAIRKNEHGVAQIDFGKCVFCGKCYSKCPFGAVMERSELFQVMRALKAGTPLIALIAPSAQFQFPGGIERLFSAVVKTGFRDVMEVALGAELTTRNEAAEFIERMRKGEKLMTTSCCTACVELVRRHVPELAKSVSTTPSPMKFAGRLAREKYPDSKTVFVGPCIAKRYESLHAPEIDFVLTFEELGALMAGLGIDVMSQAPWPLPRPAIATARNFARSCGVTEAVLKELLGDSGDVKSDSKFLNGIDARSARLLAAYAAGKMPGNFLEMMACSGGCVSGPCSLVK